MPLHRTKLDRNRRDGTAFFSRNTTESAVMKSTIASQVRDWLNQSPGQCFCDECIAKNTGADIGKVYVTTAQLGG
jgi:hypothetical protein